MKVLIVEDEPMAQANLCRTLLREYPDMEVVGMTGSVRETVEWLSAPANRPDVIFMDVELSDGSCFEIFREVNVNARVVMTTAYDSYAVKAFEVNSIDYLLKPIEKEALDRAVERCRKSVSGTDVSGLMASLNQKREYRQRFMLRINDKMTWMYTKDGQKYVMDQSLDIISTELDPSSFFRVSRNCIIASSAVRSIIKLQGGRLKINPLPECSSEILVSRSRSDDFLVWMGGR